MDVKERWSPREERERVGERAVSGYGQKLGPKERKGKECKYLLTKASLRPLKIKRNFFSYGIKLVFNLRQLFYV